VWRCAAATLSRRGWIEGDSDRIDAEALAVEYEARANPVWPMPHLGETLSALRRAGKLLGVVSNAQFYTPEAFPALAGRTLEEFGVDTELQYYSFQYGLAKPGPELYRLAAAALERRGISTAAALYVGNDVLNDILPAAQTGFLTALFAGDARSLRRRTGDARVAGVRPDAVVTSLRDLLNCVL
jgi:putative hydrolase of the HAD superfamily